MVATDRQLETEEFRMAKVGDRIVLVSKKVGLAERQGEILEVIQHEIRPEFRVRWDDGHETGIRAHAGDYRIEAAPAKSRR